MEKTKIIMVLSIEEIILPFIVPGITALVIFVSQWHKKEAEVQISVNDIQDMRDRIEHIDSKINHVIDKVNNLYTDIEVLKVRLNLNRQGDPY